MLAQKECVIENIDTTIVAQDPKLTPHIPLMRQNIAHVLDIDVSHISVKASTTEGLGFPGEGLGMIAYAIALVKEI